MPDQFQQIQQALQIPFWHRPDFWINAVLGAGGLFFAVQAFREAKAAKKAAKDAETAATEAGQFMTMQTVAIELMAISQRLTNLDQAIKFREARTLVDEITGKLHRLTSPFQGKEDLGPIITNIHESLATVKTALSGVRPSPGQVEITGQTYNAIEGEAATLNLYVNDLLGQLETKSHSQLAT